MILLKKVIATPFIALGMLFLFIGVALRYTNIAFTTDYFNRMAYMTYVLRKEYDAH